MTAAELLAARVLLSTHLANAPDDVRAAFDALVADHERSILAEKNIIKERDEFRRIVRGA